jgi:hypothetical protein
MATAITSPAKNFAALARNEVTESRSGRSLAQSSTHKLELVFLLLFALVLRVAAVLIIIKQHTPAWLFSRGTEMGLMATSILSGEGLSSPFGSHTGPTALIGPVYPLMVAAIFHLAGSYSLAAEVIVLSLQVAIAILNLWLLVQLVEFLAGRPAAFMAGLFWAVAPPIIMMPIIFWDTTFTTAALTGMCFFVLRRQGRVSRRQLYWTGVLFALASLLNSALFFISLALLALLSRGLPAQRARAFILSASIFLAVFSPWPIRNAFTFHAFVPFRTTIGLELWMGNHEGSTGHLEEKMLPLFNTQELSQYKALGEVAFDREKKHLAIEYVRSHSRNFVVLTAKRFARYWSGTGSSGESFWLGLYATFTSVFGLVGLVICIRLWGIKSTLPILLPLFLFPLPYYITHAEFRYRLVVDPLLTAFTFYGLWNLLQGFRARASVFPSREASRRLEGRL